MLSRNVRYAGYSFPSMGRLLLEPGAGDLTGGVPVDSTPVEAGGTVDAGNREPISPPASNMTGERNFEAEVGSTGTGAGTVQSGPLTPADPNQAAGYTSVRDAAKSFGYQFDREYADDESAFQAILRQAQANRQADYYAQLGRQLAPHHQAIRGYLQQQTPQAPASPARQPWEAPEFDERWIQGVERDPNTGLYLAKPGFPQEIAAKVNEYAEWKAAYDRNPAAIMNQMIESRATALFDQKFAERSALQETQQAVNSIVRENQEWFYAKDAQGQYIPGQDGRPVPSPIGAAYLRHLGAVRTMGVLNPRDQDRLAKQLLQSELLQSQAAKQQQQATANGLPARQAAMAPNVNPLTAGLTPTQQSFTPGATPPSSAGLSLNEQLSRAFAENGVTDADFAVMS